MGWHGQLYRQAQAIEPKLVQQAANGQQATDNKRPQVIRPNENLIKETLENQILN